MAHFGGTFPDDRHTTWYANGEQVAVHVVAAVTNHKLDGCSCEVTLAKEGDVRIRSTHRNVRAAFPVRFSATAVAPTLCVFHEQELLDSHGRYSTGDCTLVCTAYTADTHTTAMTLTGITPLIIIPGIQGVFLFGSSFPKPQFPVRSTQRGDLFVPVVDAWWMASPLAISPVYIKVHHARREEAAAVAPHDRQLNCLLVGEFVEASTNAWIAVAQSRATGWLALAHTQLLSIHHELLWSWLTVAVDFHLSPPNLHDTDSLTEANAAPNVTMIHGGAARGSPSSQSIFIYDAERLMVHVAHVTLMHDEADPGVVLGAELIPVTSIGGVCRPFLMPAAIWGVPPLVAVVSCGLDPHITFIDPRIILASESEIDATGSAAAPARLRVVQRLPLLTGVNRQDDVVSVRASWGRTLLLGTRDGRLLSYALTGLFDEPDSADNLPSLVLTAIESVLSDCPSLCYAIVVDSMMTTTSSTEANSVVLWDSLARLVADCVDAAFDNQHSARADCAAVSSAVAAVCEGVFPVVAPSTVSLLALVNARSRVPTRSREAALSHGSEPQWSPLFDGVASWTPSECGLVVIALHLLCESCKMQRPLWLQCARLAPLITRLASTLGWSRYVQLYRNAYDLPSTKAVAPPRTTALQSVVPTDILAQHVVGWDDSFLQGRPPDLHAALRALIEWAPRRPVWPVLTRLAPRCLAPSMSASAFEQAAPTDPAVAAAAAATASERNGAGKSAGSSRAPSLPHEGEAATSAVSGRCAVADSAHPITVAATLLDLYRSALDPEVQFRNGTPWYQAVVEAMTARGISQSFVDTVFPFGVAQPLRQATCLARDHPHPLWDYNQLMAIGRPDKARLALGPSTVLLNSAMGVGRGGSGPILGGGTATAVGGGAVAAVPPLANLGSHAHYQSRTGRDIFRSAVTKATCHHAGRSLGSDEGVLVPSAVRRWPDGRLDVVQVMLNTAVPARLSCRGDGTDAAQNALALVTTRSLAMSVGRGMMTMATQDVRVQDLLPIPPLVLYGVTSDGLTVTDAALATPEAQVWARFHNGCAAGLRYLPFFDPTQPRVITRHWIVYQTRDAMGFKGPGAAMSDGANVHGFGGFGAAGGIDAAGNTGFGGSLRGGALVAGPQTLAETRAHELSARAGLFLAIGLMGYLDALQTTDIYSFLVSPSAHGVEREPTMIALMIGLACSYRGTANDAVFRCLSVHIQSLTPTAEDLEVSLEVQTAALVSVGFVLQGSANSFIVEVMLGEISRMPTDEHCLNREGYALGAGISLGLVLLGHGHGHGLSALRIEDRLLALMNGDLRQNSSSASAQPNGGHELDEVLGDEPKYLTRALLLRTRHPQPPTCNKVLEGTHYNTAVTSPAAVIALGLMYLQTDDGHIAKKLAPPNTLMLMCALAPTTSLLRVTCTSLIMWSSTTCSRDSLYRFVPSVLVQLGQSLGEAASATASPKAPTPDLEGRERFLTLHLGFCIAGGALAIGLRHVGSVNHDARDTVLAELDGFMSHRIGTSGAPMSALQQRNGAFEPCISACAVALGLIMAGTGDSRCLVALQRLHKRTSVGYGEHLAIGMAIGLLFLSGGSCTLQSSRESVAALLVAFFPVWPRTATDNTIHLQPLRQLYALSVVPRLLQAVDLETNEPVQVDVRMVLSSEKIGPVEGVGQSASVGKMWTPMPRDTKQLAIAVTTPCLLPEPDSVDRLEVRSVDHYPLTLENAGHITRCGITVGVLRKKPQQQYQQPPLLPRAHEGASTLPGQSLLTEGKAPAVPLDLQEVINAVKRLLRVCPQRQSSAAASARGSPLLLGGAYPNHEALIVIDNLSLLLALSARFFSGAPTPGAPQGSLSVDFVTGVRRALETCFCRLFVASSGRSGDDHPLRLVVSERLSFREAAESPSTRQWWRDMQAAETLSRTSIDDTGRRSGSSSGSNDNNVTPDIAWFTQALQFYGLQHEPSGNLAAAIQANAEQLRAPAQRLGVLLSMNRALRLPLTVLEEVVKCCLVASNLAGAAAALTTSVPRPSHQVG